MNLLITNDDGFDAPGIKALYKVLSAKNKVYICAPSSQRSSCSHSITINKPLDLYPIEGGFALNGTPADCVKAAAMNLFKNIELDLIISGINDGVNMGSDIYYSGTIAAAREGTMLGFKSIACSIEAGSSEEQLLKAASFIEKYILDINNLPENKQICNINFPNFVDNSKFKYTTLGRRKYSEYVERTILDEKQIIKIIGNEVGFLPVPNSDLSTVFEKGSISITLLDII